MTPLRMISAPVRLYVHIPFCSRKCGYFDFLAVPYPGDARAAAVLDQIRRQADYLLESLGTPPVETVYVGGGTPSVIPASLLEPFLLFLAAISPGQREFTVEANPETLCPSFLALCAASGVTRISIGIQSFHGKLLETIGRSCAPESIATGLAVLARYWNGDSSFDLLCGIPGESIGELESDLDRLSALRSQHLSVYVLSIERGTKLWKRVSEGTVIPCSEEEVSEQRDLAVRFLAARGYRNYEVSNFSLPGKESRHNLGYWRMDPYIGCGPGAVSTLPGAEGPVRLHGTRSVDRFIEGRAGDWGISTEEIAPEDFLLEHLMMGLRLSDGLEAARIAAVFSAPLTDLIPATLRSWKNRGLMMPGEERYVLTEAGRDILNPLLTEAYAEIDTRVIPDP
jgi:oxygen-independent coproporphyrinogen-3 oxidase